MKADYSVFESKMKKSLDVLAHNFGAIRAGRANPAVLDKIMIEYYNVPTPLAQVAAVSTPDPRTLSIQPWDASVLKQIEKAIQMSDIGINPQNDGKAIRLAFPPLTEERRKELIKQVSKEGEECKVALRNIRRDALEQFKAQKKKNEMSEDELADAEDGMLKIIDKYGKEVDGMTAKKSKELAEV